MSLKPKPRLEKFEQADGVRLLRLLRARPAKVSRYLAIVVAVCRAERWPEPQAERTLIPGRRFCCDLVWESHRLVVEVQGGVWLPKGGHTGGRAQLDDMEKMNLLQLAGWRVLQVSPKGVTDGTLRTLLAAVFGGKIAEHSSASHT